MRRSSAGMLPALCLLLRWYGLVFDDLQTSSLPQFLLDDFELLPVLFVSRIAPDSMLEDVSDNLERWVVDRRVEVYQCNVLLGLSGIVF